MFAELLLHVVHRLIGARELLRPETLIKEIRIMASASSLKGTTPVARYSSWGWNSCAKAGSTAVTISCGKKAVARERRTATLWIRNCWVVSPPNKNLTNLTRASHTAYRPLIPHQATQKNLTTVRLLVRSQNLT